MRKNSKFRIYKTYMKPIINYEIETHADTTRAMILLWLAEMKTLRAIAGKTLRDPEKKRKHRRTLKCIRGRKMVKTKI